MRYLVVVLPLVLILGNIIGLDRWSVSCSNSDNFVSVCNSVSQIGDLCGYSNRNINGFNYCFLNFDRDDVVFVATLYYDFQPGIVYDLRFINIKGIIIRVNGELFYINLMGDGARITFIPASGTLNLPNGGLDLTLPGTAVSLSLAFVSFQRITGKDYNAQCNQFIPGTGVSPCSCQSPYIIRTPVEAVSLAECRSTVVGYLFQTNDNATGAGLFADAYGLNCLNVRKEAGTVPLSNPPIFIQDVNTINSDYPNNNFPSCKYCGPSIHFEIEKKCGCTLSNCDVCKLARYYENAYAKKKESSSFLSLLFFPRLDGQTSYAFNRVLTRDAISFFFQRGHIVNSFQDTLARYLFNICRQ